MNCSSVLKSLSWCEGVPALAGIRKRAYYIQMSAIAGFPILPKDENGRVISSTLKGSFVLKADEVFRYIEFNPDQSQHTSEGENEIPSQLNINKLTLVHPGVGPEATEAAAYLNNNNCVFVWQDMNGRWRVTGANLYHNKVSVSQDNGQGATGTASTTISVEAHDYIPSPFYTGILMTEEGEIDCSLGDNVPDVEP